MTPYEQIIALIKQEAQDAVDGGLCTDREEAILAIIENLAQDCGC